MGMGGGGGGEIPGMGFLQMFMNQGKDKGGGGGPQPPAYGGTPPGGTPGQPAPGGAQPAFKQTPGFSQAVPLFGNMEDDDLAAYMAANGIRQPQGK